MSHFCEIHGPTSILCTQAFSSAVDERLISPFEASSTPACRACQLVSPRGLLSHFKKSGNIPILRSRENSNIDALYISMKTPRAQSRFRTLRESCLRSLSIELIPGKTGSVLFGNQESGYTIAYIFRVPDSRARGGCRLYALLYLHPSENHAIDNLNYVIGMFEAKVRSIINRANSADDRNRVVIGSRSLEGFLRRRDTVVPISLCDLTDQDDFFIEMHASFSEILSAILSAESVSVNEAPLTN